MPEVEKHVTDLVVGIDKVSPKIIKFVLWMVLSVVMLFLSFSLTTSNPIRLVHIDAIDYAQIARNFSRGEGLTTKFIRPISLRFANRYQNHPELTSPPLYPVYLSSVMKLFDVPYAEKPDLDRKVIQFGSGLFFILCVPFFIWLGHKLTKSNVAYLSLFFFITNVIVLRSAVSGLPDMFLTFIFMLFLIAFSYYDGENIFKPALIGALLGLCYLTRYSYGLFSIPLVIYFYVKAKKYKLFHSLMFLVTFLAVIAPWLVRNFRITGNPFFTLEWYKYKMFTELLPGNIYWRAYVEEIFQKQTNLFLIVRKFGMGLKSNYVELLNLTGNFLVCFFVVAFFYLGFKTKQNKFLWFTLILFAIMITVSSIFRPGASVLFPFLPYVILVAVYLFIDLLDKRNIDPFVRFGILTLFIIINMLPVMFMFMPRIFSDQMYRQPKQYWEENIVDVAKMAPKDSVIVSDIPWATAWYGNFVSVWLPWDEPDFAQISKDIGTLDGAFFSPMILRYPQDEIKVWLKIYSYLINYESLPADNKFGWKWSTRYRRGDIFCFKEKLQLTGEVQ